MKKLISCLLILSATAILLFSCADGDATDTTTTTEKLPDTNEPVTEPTAADLLLTKMQDAGCPADKLPTIERELNAEELEAIKVWIATEEVRALLGCYTFYSPETIELNGFIYGYQGEGHVAPEE